jgi:hypothetical protein
MTIVGTINTKEQIVLAIAKLRQEWQEAALDGESLVQVKGSVGLILADLVKALELSSIECAEALGVELANELQVRQPVR